LKRFGWLLLVAALAGSAEARNVQYVSFASVDRDASGAPVMLRGVLLLPATPPPPGGYPAIVALHGCGGMYSARGGHKQELAERMALRADLFLAEGYAVLLPDSFSARGRREVCTIKTGERTVNAPRRKLDALGALAYLATRREIARGRVALVGWSHGGSTVLQTINVRDPDVAAFIGRPESPPFYRAAVAFYPGCRVPLQAGDRWRPGPPTRVHIGELDDWTPAEPCVELGAVEAAREDDFKVYTYADSYHAFDSPTGKVILRIDVPNGVHPGEGVHVGPNPEARKLANARVHVFLDQHLRP
jgi:dienelactone hydrolase